MAGDVVVGKGSSGEDLYVGKKRRRGDRLAREG
jgi:hypothetical protein